VVDLALLKGVREGPDDVLLAHDVCEGARTVAAVERRGRHERGESRALAGGIALAAAGVAWLLVNTGFANYDTAYSLLWGADLAHGRMPDFSVALAPTPHPLTTLQGLVLSPLGDGAETVTVVLAFLTLGAVTALTYLLGTRWFGPAAGALAAAIVITREPVLSFGTRAYLDLPYLAFVLGAIYAEARRPRAGTPVLLLLGLAGLLRPEAWLFAAAYWLYLFWPDRKLSPELVRLGLLAAAAPLIWLASDWALAGDPLHSLLDTRDNARDLQRATGLDEVPVTVPRRIGEILREPVLLGAVIGAWVAWRRQRLPLVAGAVALVAFCVLAAAGLPILGRYLLLPAVLGAILCGAALTAHRAAAVLVLVALAAFTPAQADRIDRLRANLGFQREIRDDLHEIAPQLRCAPVQVETHRPIPLLALWLDRRPSDFVTEGESRSAVVARTDRVRRNFLLDRSDPARRATPAVTGRAMSMNRSWVVYDGC
jgi:hypothetical protein